MAALRMLAERPEVAVDGALGRRRLGRTDLSLTVLGFGGGSLFCRRNEEQVQELIVRAYQAGIRYYSGGLARSRQ